MAGREDDERWLVVDGRRWRRQDPSLPDDVRRALLSHLGRGRSGVRAAKGDAEAVAAARRRTQLAKGGLGERSEPWWDQTPVRRKARWEAALEALAALDPGDGRSR